MDKTKDVYSDLDHWCSYNGIAGDNKKELISIIENIVKSYGVKI